jgi:hypothetical protein
LEIAIVAAHNKTMLYPKHIPTHIPVRLIRNIVSKNDEQGKITNSSVKIMTLKELMKLTSVNIKEVCKISGLGRARLYQLIKKHSISIPDILKHIIFKNLSEAG